MKFIRYFLISLLLSIIVGILVQQAFAANENLTYVALGDSLAEGVNDQGEKGKSYADYIAERFEEDGTGVDFKKEYATAGFTSEDLRNQLKKREVKHQVKEADLITISIGANDFLSLVKKDENGKIRFKPEDLAPTLAHIQENVRESIASIRKLNKEADIYVSGYYYPFPHMKNKDLSNTLKEVTRWLNGTIQDVVEKEGATYVPVFEKFEEDPTTYVPNPKNIHPNEAGYRVMAEAFFDVYED
ncbi:hypothetical protein N781_17300 [Pontibacillus halophilus JSM 076056 = DSM 19796]|uniref:SGNH hydrolase-type esterase domain-containing protein n=1 Tax=Pontibacillus halophilus JSM 076056 = DSM 19796 TaxID=1385510 RepID=A0A0A5GH24_9BACI|nr:GDSL-type esterase/lipase family protein [Pontibacillus halophilus]KGX92531.1 hypothetical protein N781_17300 [Pontibacillus halophilus JSM 076056 = DSM 19796]